MADPPCAMPGQQRPLCVAQRLGLMASWWQVQALQKARKQAAQEADAADSAIKAAEAALEKARAATELKMVVESQADQKVAEARAAIPPELHVELSERGGSGSSSSEGIDADVLAAMSGCADWKAISRLDSACTICLGAPMHAPARLKSCRHEFCSNCIKRWVGENKSCPQCRAAAQLGDVELVPRGKGKP